MPQDPVVFSGSIRSNLDPFSQAASDADVWGALRQAGLDTLVRSMGVRGRHGGGVGGGYYLQVGMCMCVSGDVGEAVWQGVGGAKGRFLTRGSDDMWVASGDTYGRAVCWDHSPGSRAADP